MTPTNRSTTHRLIPRRTKSTLALFLLALLAVQLPAQTTIITSSSDAAGQNLPGGSYVLDGFVINTNATGYALTFTDQIDLVIHDSGSVSGWGGITTAGGTVINLGTIHGRANTGYSGIYSNIALTTNNIGLIAGDTGIQLNAGGTVTNSGTITGTGGYGVHVSGGEAEITNNNGGLIRGGIHAGGTTTITQNGIVTGTKGIWLGADSTLSGTGTIDVTGTALTLADTQNHTISDMNLLRGSLAGVSLENTGTLVNTGTVIGIDTYTYIAGAGAGVGVESTGTGAVEITNSAHIEGGNSGINLASGGMIDNSGTILGSLHRAGSAGIRTKGVTDITNSGYINGDTTGICFDTDADGGTIHNTGIIRAIDHYISAGIEANSSILVTNAATGLIEGINTGIWLKAGATIANTGTINGTGSASVGIRNENAGSLTTITNNAAGSITGALAGVNTQGNLTLVNNGTITTANTYNPNGDGVHVNGRADITNTGYIGGVRTSVSLDTGPVGSIVRNSGTITSNGNAIHIRQNDTIIINQAGGFIHSYDYGIYADGVSAIVTNKAGSLIQGSEKGVLLQSGTIINAGRITANVTAMQIDTPEAYVENNLGGHINGTVDAVSLTQGGTVANSGTIAGGVYGIKADGAIVVKNTGGYIHGGVFGMNLLHADTITNTGTIIGGDFGIYIRYNGNATIANTTTGLIQGGYAGVMIGSGGTITNSGTIAGGNTGIHASEIPAIMVENTTTGLIRGASSGVYFHVSGTMANSGLIQGGTHGVWLSDGGSVLNEGTIRGADNDGVAIGRAPGMVINTGLIEGGDAAVQFDYGGTMQNTGTLMGDYGVHALSVYVMDGPVLVENTTGALINSTHTSLLLSGGTVLNAGRIESSGGKGISSSGLTVVTNTTGGIINGGDGAAVLLTADTANEVHLWNGSTLAGDLDIAGAASKLTLNSATGATQLYSGAVTGNTTFTGTLAKQGPGTWTIDKNPGAGMAQQTTLVDAGKLIVHWDQYQLGGSAVNIAAGAILETRAAGTTGTTTLVNPLTGAGLLDLVDTAMATAPRGTFALDPAMGSSFSGTIGVGSARGHKVIFDLATSETALANAILKLNTDSETTLDTNREIGGLDLAGGTLIVKSGTIGTELIPRTLTVKTLAISETGGTAASKIGVDTETLLGINPPIPPGDGLNGSIFDEDILPPDILPNQHTIVDSTVSGPADGIALDLADSDGHPLASGTDTPRITFRNQGGTTDAGVNTHGYNAVTQDGDILLNYGLISIESTNSAETVIIDSTGSLDKTLSAKLTGLAGGAGFTLAGGETITLAHTANDYTGATLITDDTTLKGGAFNVIASSTQVTIATGAAFDLGHHNQTLQNVSGEGGIHLRDKTLTIITTGTGVEFSGVIDDNGLAGNMTLAAGSEWTLTGENTHTGTTTIATGAQLQLGNGGLTGMINDASAIANNGTLTINRSDDLAYAGTVTGDGAFVQRGGNTTTLTGANKIDGGLVVENGTLMIGQGDETGWHSSTIAANARVDANAALTFNRSDIVTYDGVISGPGAMATLGSGTLALKKMQAHTGPTSIVGSTLRTDIANALNASSGLLLAHGTLDLNNHNQTIKNLTGTDGRIRYSTNRGDATTYTNLTITGALGGTTTSYMNIDLAGKKSDTLAIRGAATGTHSIVFSPATDPTLLDDPERTHALKVIDYGGGDAVFTSNGIDSGMHTYRLHKGDGGKIMGDTTAYYLSGGDTLSRAADAILLTAGVMGTDWHYSLDNLRKRLGEIRANLPVNSGNVWARANNHRLNADSGPGGGSFEQDTYGITAGGDKIFRREQAILVAGAYLAMNHSDRTFDDARNQYGDGKNNTIGAGLYALWLHDNAWFVDATLRADRSANELSARGVDGIVSRGKHTNQIQGISIEAGRRLVNGIYWVEPSAQAAVAWINGAGYTVSNGVSRDLRVHIGDSEARQYRGQIRTGADYGRWQPHINFGATKTDSSGGEVAAEGRGYQPWFDGWRLEAGAGVGYLIDKRSQVYFDYEYNKASAYERPWSLTLGYRKAW